MKKKIFLFLALVLSFAVMSAYGQMMSLKATIDFPFMVKDKALPAGEYMFVREPSGMLFKVQGAGDNFALAMVVTLISKEIHTTPVDAHIVFDKVGDSFILSEIWIPGQDGFLMATTGGTHVHKVLNVKY